MISGFVIAASRTHPPRIVTKILPTAKQEIADVRRAMTFDPAEPGSLYHANRRRWLMPGAMRVFKCDGNLDLKFRNSDSIE
jgi:hypothetical protein